MLDYKSLGFKSGIEIHNRLATKHKLFCNCPPRFSSKQPNLILKRNLRTVPGELGEVDPAALYEFLRGRTFIYQNFSDTTCEVERDEEPPHAINKEALELGLTIATMLRCQIPEEIHVMRKTVIDGSNTSGFQRTALVGINGTLETSAGPVRITNVCIEEEAAGIVEQKDGEMVYRLDRLGIPLVEIGTATDIKNPKHAKEVAAKLGMIVRSTGKSQRGIGSIRQDVNVSIAGGARIEIKGVQELDLIDFMIENEIRRQIGLLKLKDELNRRGASVSEIYAVTEFFKETKNKIISNILHAKGKVWLLKLPGWAGLLGAELAFGRTFGKELADYARAYGVKGLIHTDEDLAIYKLEIEFGELAKRFNLKDADALLIIAGGPEAETAIKAVRERALLALKEVPKETRIANPDGTTKYARPLPGAERMYPETDIPVIPITKEILSAIKLPETWEQKRERFSKILPAELVETILRSEYLDWFESFEKRYDPVIVANTLTSVIKDLRRRGFPTEQLTEEHLTDLFSAVKQKLIAKEAIPSVLERASNKPHIMISDIIKAEPRLSEADLRKIIKEIFAKYPALVKDKKLSALMGEIMTKVRGRIDGATVKRILEDELRY